MLVLVAVAIGVALGLLAMPAMLSAKAPPEEVAKLGNELTPMGAIRAGNADGSIPPWEGGLSEPPAGWEPGTWHIDPFADDEILYSITAANTAVYADLLSPGQMAMLERYPDTWKLNVYPTRRSAALPERVYEAAIANASSAELVNDGNGIAGAATCSPFPIPQNGLETIWNHVLRYRFIGAEWTLAQAAVTSGGSFTLVTLNEKALFPYAQPGQSTETIDNLFVYFWQAILGPPRLAGRILVVHDTIDQVKQPRSAWTYNPGQRRVRRAPQVAYDNPGTACDGLRTSDDYDVFAGAPDRFDWELIGRRELIVPYNAYRLHGDIPPEEILHAGHINPERARYERHRVWVVEARVKEGMRHLYPRRTFYLDEDSWLILLADQYDARGDIWRVSEDHAICYYEHPTYLATQIVWYDLQNGRYLTHGLDAGQLPADIERIPDVQEFTTSAMRRAGRR
jgi:hypothetical protein